MIGPRGGLGARLLLALLLVVLVGGATLLVVALALAPGLFRTHVEQAVGPVSPGLAAHLDTAFARAVLISLAVAVTAATGVALAVGVFVTRRAVRPIEELSRAASAIAAGDYAVRVHEDGLGSELATLTRAFNRMASDLAGTERTRAEMLRDLAHELRTPLTSVRGYHEAIADGVLPADRATFARVDAELSRVERLVDDLDQVSRAEERLLDLRLQPVDAADLVAATADGARATASEAGVSVLTSPPEEPGTDPGAGVVLVDPDRLHEALANLVTNALRHTPAGGTVRLSSRTRGQVVELTVTDTGEGIAAEHLPRVLERFYRVDDGRSRTTGGSGIGLTITRALVEAHGGRVRIESAGPGHGTTAVLTLPRWQPPSPR
ncbi:sensor histidine kinase [Cellulomonas soli]|uniref:histidine kinase n=1 Tax=Cellulomonas soli TaxID=931535 RepID=A0A512PGJ1_9CELL|nr:ATP-binding protein [Cellulomonas soli]NYI58186.1 signal transduction histidine kinase [Cellulomonas soli]GEP70319.1 two-component sensor histidine kinase [Cellulomonas soli]